MEDTRGWQTRPLDGVHPIAVLARLGGPARARSARALMVCVLSINRPLRPGSRGCGSRIGGIRGTRSRHHEKAEPLKHVHWVDRACVAASAAALSRVDPGTDVARGHACQISRARRHLTPVPDRI
jgi:hypothetical protein